MSAYYYYYLRVTGRGGPDDGLGARGQQPSGWATSQS